MNQPFTLIPRDGAHYVKLSGAADPEMAKEAFLAALLENAKHISGQGVGICFKPSGVIILFKNFYSGSGSCQKLRQGRVKLADALAVTEMANRYVCSRG